MATLEESPKLDAMCQVSHRKMSEATADNQKIPERKETV